MPRCAASCGATRATRRQLDNEALIREEYAASVRRRAIPACPDHAVKAPLFEVLRADAIGMIADRELRHAADRRGVGLLLSRIPTARYFAVGRIGDDQLRGFRAARRAFPTEEARRRLAPNLG